MERLAGSDRNATAAAISAATFAPGTPIAYVATGATFPDALAAGAAAASHDGPVLLVATNSIPVATANELARLQPGTIKVIGGTAMVSDGVLNALRGYATSGNVERIAGNNRYATAAAVSADTFATGVPVAYIATGEMFPDALSGAGAAGMSGGPILLVRPDAIPPRRRASSADSLLVGSWCSAASAVVSDAVAAGLIPYATSGNVTRLAGSDRYATAVAVSSGTFTSGPTVFVATGINFPDALGGGPVAGGLPGPLLLVPGTRCRPACGRAEPPGSGHGGHPGGYGLVSDEVASQIESLLAD